MPFLLSPEVNRTFESRSVANDRQVHLANRNIAKCPQTRMIWLKLMTLSPSAPSMNNFKDSRCLNVKMIPVLRPCCCVPAWNILRKKSREPQRINPASCAPLVPARRPLVALRSGSSAPPSPTGRAKALPPCRRCAFLEYQRALRLAFSAALQPRAVAHCFRRCARLTRAPSKRADRTDPPASG